MAIKRVLVTKNLITGRWNMSCTCCDKDLSCPLWLVAYNFADAHARSRHCHGEIYP